MTNIFVVADFFLKLNNGSENDDVTNMKLQKLLYFAQGHYAARTGKRLFENDFEAWRYGPVVRAVYEKYQNNGKSVIPPVAREVSNDLSQEEFALVSDVAREYGKYSASHLSLLTHDYRSPWKTVYYPHRQNVITFDSIYEYFKSQKTLPTLGEMLKEQDVKVVGYRNENGDYVLPKEEYDECDDYFDELYAELQAKEGSVH